MKDKKQKERIPLVISSSSIVFHFFCLSLTHSFIYLSLVHCCCSFSLLCCVNLGHIWSYFLMRFGSQCCRKICRKEISFGREKLWAGNETCFFYFFFLSFETASRDKKKERDKQASRQMFKLKRTPFNFDCILRLRNRVIGLAQDSRLLHKFYNLNPQCLLANSMPLKKK